MIHLNAFAKYRCGGLATHHNVPDADLKALVAWILATR